MLHKGQVGADGLETCDGTLNLRTIAPWQHAFGNCPGSADACWVDKWLAPAVYASRCCQHLFCIRQASGYLHFCRHADSVLNHSTLSCCAAERLRRKRSTRRERTVLRCSQGLTQCSKHARTRLHWTRPSLHTTAHHRIDLGIDIQRPGGG